MSEAQGRPEKDNEIGRFIEGRMSQLGLTQREVADIVGFKNRNMLSFIKNGDGKLPLERVAGMARALKVPASELFEMALRQHYSSDTIELMKQALTEASLSRDEAELLDLFRVHVPRGKFTADALRRIADEMEKTGKDQAVEAARKQLAEAARFGRKAVRNEEIEPEES